MNFLIVKEKEPQAKNTFKLLIALLFANVIWAIYELSKYIKYLLGRNFLSDFITWTETNLTENILYLFSNFIGILGVIAFIYALIRLIKGKPAIKALTISFLLQLISCSALVIDNILMFALPTYLNGIVFVESFYFFVLNILLVATLFTLMLYMTKACQKESALAAAEIMLLVNMGVIFEMFLVNLGTALGFFFTLSLSIKLLYILISIATLVTIKYTEFKQNDYSQEELRESIEG